MFQLYNYILEIFFYVTKVSLTNIILIQNITNYNSVLKRDIKFSRLTN